MQSQGNLLNGMDYFQRQWSHARKAKWGKMKNLITYLMTMNVEDKVNMMRLEMLTHDGSPGPWHERVHQGDWGYAGRGKDGRD